MDKLRRVSAAHDLHRVVLQQPMTIDPLTPFGLVVYGLACFRLSLLLSKETGPAWIFSRIRRSVPAKSSAKEGIKCIWCVAIWHSIPMASFAWFQDSLPDWLTSFGDWFILMLALSSIAIIINQQWTKG